VRLYADQTDPFTGHKLGWGDGATDQINWEATRTLMPPSPVRATNGPITIAIRARFEYDSATIRLQHATTRYEVFRALAYEIVYENQW